MYTKAAGATRLAIDIGGTFTDVALEIESARYSTKVLTTHKHPEEGLLAGVDAVLALAGTKPSQVDSIVHGTTLATNTLIERKGAKVALLCTSGFRDTLEMAHEDRFEQYDVFMRRPAPLVPRHLRFDVPERVAADGQVLVALDDRRVAELAQELQSLAVDSVAVTLLHSYVNPEHEQRIRDVLHEASPGLAISLSSEVCPEIREYERMSTTAANAYVQPLIRAYLTTLEEKLKRKGFRCAPLMIMSSGTIATLDTACRFPIRIVESGPAGGAIFAAGLAAEHGKRAVLSFDMGGTTAKMCFIDEFTPQFSASFEVAREYRFQKGSGMPLKIPAIEMVEIGAGGGSIGAISRLGVIAVGPQSAGSEPGPACYGRGGTAPTVTDADVALGRIEPEGFAGGRMMLDTTAAQRALHIAIGEGLGMSAAEAAAAVSELVDENMANAARIHAAESGKDVMTRTMIAFGGAAPLHAARVAEKLGIDEIIIPAGAGVGSAIGFLRARIAYEVTRTRYMDLRQFDALEVNRLFSEMRQQAETIVRLGAPDAELEEQRIAFMRYRGQGHELAVHLPIMAYTSKEERVLIDAFETRYRSLYGRTIPALVPEVVSWSLTLGARRNPQRPTEEDDRAREVRSTAKSRMVYEPQTGEEIRYSVYRREGLARGDAVRGPALICEDETTTVVSSGYDARVMSSGHIVLKRRR